MVGPRKKPRSASVRNVSTVRAAMNPRVFAPDTIRGLWAVARGIAVYLLSLLFAAWAWKSAPVWAWPLSWILTGTAVTGLFVLGHDCGHGSLLPHRRVQTVLGHLLFIPSLYPFYAWRFTHEAHHAHTNALAWGRDVYYDNAWVPATRRGFERLRTRSPWRARLYLAARTFVPLGSTMHLTMFHYRPGKFRPQHRRLVWVSLLAMAVAAAVIVAACIALTGSVFAALHFWLLPALFFQPWMAVYTFLQHTADDRPLYPPDTWTPYDGQFRGTINVRHARFISWLHFHIDVHVPHHLSVRIPCYRLPEANEALLRSEFGPEVKELPFSWRYLIEQVRQCQIWDEATGQYGRVDHTPPALVDERASKGLHETGQPTSG